MFIRERDVDVIDQEWMELILEARDLGLSIEDVRNFLYPDSQKEASSTY
ncbi:anti-repressor SinI family protein [Neobacillus sp. WH10]|nr:anti-repressor SinI family protein [Neobacillus sp. WH10]WHY78733.1 anti-repressor SinI family protein [Neobacillus sp. WH10]